MARSDKKGKTAETSITSILTEERVFKPDPAFSRQAHIKSFAQYKRLYASSVKNPQQFWAKIAGELDWFRKWKRVLKWNVPFAEWFVGGRLNVSFNCLDRHLTTARKNKAALIWEGEPGDTRVLTYQELHYQVCKFTNVLKALGVQKGDRVVIYMPLVPELA
ncbi:MAG TPA: acetyl-coenzyme A synthetase N-terminal domain-containing protein, partial [Acidobacteriota bacterium]|nr:acetyl-coenzyme A synthetase N-terminal domain-containing protein [Acidobacteriota bacterium]